MKNLLKFFVIEILTLEARLVLTIYNPKIVAITGNVGKTSAKDAIYTALSGDLFVRKSDKSFNSEIGIPLTILGLKNAWSNPFGWLWNIISGFFTIFNFFYPRVLVLEVGADRPGDIKHLSRWLKPDIAVYTRMQAIPVHVENFGSIEKVYEEKSYLVGALKRDGVLVINCDDEKMKTFTKNSRSVMTFGFENKAVVRGENYAVSYDSAIHSPEGIKWSVYTGGVEYKCFQDGILGKHHVYPMLAGVSVALLFGITPDLVIEKFKKHKPPHGRMKILKGVRGSTLIDDSHNSSPVALEEALNVLGELRAKGRKIAVLGDMKELGSYSKAEHRRLGALAGKSAYLIITVGTEAEGFAQGARDSGTPSDFIHSFSDSVKAGDYLSELIKEGDIVLIKGSQSMRMEKITRILLDKSFDPVEHLVRQEREWGRK
jgi:UDP-N-acetylmuramoyl-tripeptide--D-alanyl-D-alanine ligase